MTNRYYDTSDLRLASHGASLRFRDGEGWTVQLEIQRSDHAIVRAEHVFSGDGDRIPEQALDLVAAFARGAPLQEVADQLPRLAGAPHVRTPKRVETVGGLIGGRIADSFEAIVHNDPGIRLGLDPENVHQARVATRRLRSDLRAFRSMLDADCCDALRR